MIGLASGKLTRTQFLKLAGGTVALVGGATVLGGYDALQADPPLRTSDISRLGLAGGGANRFDHLLDVNIPSPPPVLNDIATYDPTLSPPGWTNKSLGTLGDGRYVLRAPTPTGDNSIRKVSASNSADDTWFDARRDNLAQGMRVHTQQPTPATTLLLYYGGVNGDGSAAAVGVANPTESEVLQLFGFTRDLKQVVYGLDNPAISNLQFLTDAGNVASEIDYQAPIVGWGLPVGVIARHRFFTLDDQNAVTANALGFMRRNQTLTQTVEVQETGFAGGYKALGRAVKSSTVNSTFSNSLLENNFTQVYSVIGGSQQVDRTIRLTSSGTLNTDPTTAVNLNLRIKFGSTILASTTPIALGLNLMSVGWYVQLTIVCRSTGVGGTVDVQGFAIINGVTISLANAAPITIDTTVAQTLQVSEQFSQAATTDSITQRQFIVEFIR